MTLAINTQVELRDKHNLLSLIAKGTIIEIQYNGLRRVDIATIECNDNKIRQESLIENPRIAIWDGEISQTDVDNMLCIAALQWHRKITSLKTIIRNINGLDNVEEVQRLCSDNRYFDVIKLTVMQSHERTRRGFIKNIEKKDLDYDQVDDLIVKRFGIDPKNGDSIYRFIEDSYYY